MIDARCLQDLLREATEAAGSTAAALADLERLQRLNLRPETHKEVQALIEEYRRRLGLLNTLSHALSGTTSIVGALLADGHPSLPTREVSPEVHDDLARKLAALQRRRPGRRVSPGEVA